MNVTTLAALMEHPPVRTTVIQLDDTTTCQIHELPIAVIDRVRTISEEDDHVDMSDVVYVATYALCGRKPTDAELDTVSERFGTRSVMTLYSEALKFSHLSADAIEQEKKTLKADGWYRLLFDLALRLHKSVQEIRQLPCSELTGWIAYFGLQNEPPPTSEHDEYIQMRKVLG